MPVSHMVSKSTSYEKGWRKGGYHTFKKSVTKFPCKCGCALVRTSCLCNKFGTQCAPKQLRAHQPKHYHAISIPNFYSPFPTKLNTHRSIKNAVTGKIRILMQTMVRLPKSNARTTAGDSAEINRLEAGEETC